MQASRMVTIQVPAAGATAQPISLATAGAVPLRVLVRNIGPTLLFLGHASGDVAGPGGPTPETFRLPIGAEDIFVLVPKQVLYVVGAGVGGLVCAAVSEALPIEKVM